MTNERQDTLNRRAFKTALHTRDPVLARDKARFFAERLIPSGASALEQRLWEIAVAYSEVANTGSARKQVRYFVRTLIRRQGVPAALVELQAWARAHRSFAILTDAGVPELTCEFVILEFAEHFSAEAASRARRALLEHGSALTSRG